MTTVPQATFPTRKFKTGQGDNVWVGTVGRGGYLSVGPFHVTGFTFHSHFLIHKTFRMAVLISHGNVCSEGLLFRKYLRHYDNSTVCFKSGLALKHCVTCVTWDNLTILFSCLNFFGLKQNFKYIAMLFYKEKTVCFKQYVLVKKLLILFSLEIA